jgi:Uma2 family endonuclease
MTAEATHHQFVSEEEYLAGELTSDVKREYLAGMVHAMAGVTNLHEVICFNLYGQLIQQLEGGRCRPFGTNTKVRVRQRSDIRFYYPDASVVCRQNPLDDQFQDEPEIIFEVLSDSTRHTDEREKRLAYCGLDSLQAYVLIEQDKVSVTVWRRTADGFRPETHVDPAAAIEFSAPALKLSLARLYSGTELIS